MIIHNAQKMICVYYQINLVLISFIFENLALADDLGSTNINSKILQSKGVRSWISGLICLKNSNQNL